MLLGLPEASWGRRVSWSLLRTPGAPWRLLDPPGASRGQLESPGASWGALGPPEVSWGPAVFVSPWEYSSNPWLHSSVPCCIRQSVAVFVSPWYSSVRGISQFAVYVSPRYSSVRGGAAPGMAGHATR